jgi:hypothetical protein
MSAIQHFILVFDRHEGRLLDQISFGQHGAAAVSRYAEIEEEYRDNPSMDIVLIGSDSIETVKITHANYFDGTARDRYADVLRIA